MTYFIFFIFLLILIEIKARKTYFKDCGLPYIPKRIGEYPYDEFLQDCGPPLNWKLQPGYGKGQVHINSLGLRSPEIQAGRRHIWVVGESEFFGAKLIREEAIWFKALQQHLDLAGHDFQVMNASVIGYNGFQAAETVTRLPIEKGDILLVRPNQNDVSIAYVQGSSWEPGNTWPMAFVHKLKRHKAWYLKLLDLSCTGLFLRRKYFKNDEKQKAFAPRPGFQWEALLACQETQLRRMIDYATGRGAQVAFFDFAASYEPTIAQADEAKLSAIQANWQSLVEGWSDYQFGAMEEGVRRLAVPLGLPVLRTAPHIWHHPKRYLLFLDLVHLNEQGHTAMARALYDELLGANLLTS